MLNNAFETFTTKEDEKSHMSYNFGPLNLTISPLAQKLENGRKRQHDLANECLNIKEKCPSTTYSKFGSDDPDCDIIFLRNFNK